MTAELHQTPEGEVACQPTDAGTVSPHFSQGLLEGQILGWQGRAWLAPAGFEKMESFAACGGDQWSIASARRRPSMAVGAHWSEPACFGLLHSERSGSPVGVLAAQVRPDLLIEVLPGITASHRNPDFTNSHPDLCADFQQLQPDG